MLSSLTEKQKEYWNESGKHRWGIKCGATRSGKTFLDYYLIPKRIRALSGKDGLYVILGNTKSTLQRNIIEPLQNIWGVGLVSDIKSDNTAIMFGEKVHCIGADKINQVNRLRGSSIKYCYGDEVATWHEDVFDMLKSRLDKEYSRFDGTCNPENPKHWFKKFIDTPDIDIYYQRYTLYDNPFNPPEFVRNLELEYRGTVYFDRYILGKWQQADGLVFPQLANDPSRWIITADEVPEQFRSVTVGLDVGGQGSYHAMCCIGEGYDGIYYAIKSISVDPHDMTMIDIERMVCDFCGDVERKFKCGVEFINCDWVDVVINSINDNTPYRCGKTYKPPLTDRPLALGRLLATGKIKFVRGMCNALIDEMQNVVYDGKAEKDIMLDDGTQRIDTIDALIYSFPSWAYLTGDSR